MTTPAYIRRTGQCLLFAFATWLLAGPLALLQMGAWAWMIASYSQEGSLQAAVQDTFSGERPCGLCKLISEVESEHPGTPAQSSTSESKDLKLLPIPVRPAGLPKPPGQHAAKSGLEQFVKDPVLEEPGPPPRGFA